MSWLRSVYFLDQNRGWVAGSNGTLLQTIDGGATWKKLLSPTKDTFHDVYFADENVGWVVAERDLLKLKTNEEPVSYLLKTKDGGLNWQRLVLTNPENARLLRAVFADRQRGWVFGESGVVFATSDGGAHWAEQASSTKHLLLGGAFVDYAHGWLVGAGATILQTSNGGMRWQAALVRDAPNARLTSASFADTNFGWAVGDAGQIFATTDGGRAWHAQESGVGADLFDVKFVDASEGWAVGTDGLLLHTSDAGKHWAAESSGTSHKLLRLFFIDRNHGWAVGFGGTILKYGENEAPRLK